MNPKISVIICTYNRDRHIASALESLSRQTLEKQDYEILVVNNNSTDNTDTICRKFVAEHPALFIRYVIEKQQGLSFARNRGIAEAQSPIITYIDDDAIAEPDFLRQILTYLDQNPDVVGIGGRIEPIYENGGGEPAWMNPFLHGIVAKVDMGNEVKPFVGGKYPAGCNMTYRKTVLQQSGGFNEELKWRADDKYIYREVAKISNKVMYLPQAKVWHHIEASRTSWQGFVNLSRRIGSEEKIRVGSLHWTAYLKKLLEFLIKLAGSLVLAFFYALKGRFSVALYLVACRWYALIGFLS